LVGLYAVTLQGQTLKLVERGEDEEKEQLDATIPLPLEQEDSFASGDVLGTPLLPVRMHCAHTLTRDACVGGSHPGWQTRCTRALFGSEAIDQPRALSHGRPLCFACATTCRLPTDLSGWIVNESAPLSACACAADPARECLFALAYAAHPHTISCAHPSRVRF
jgi:hypothetical protein